MIINQDFPCGMWQATNQSEAMFENYCKLTWMLTWDFLNNPGPWVTKYLNFSMPWSQCHHLAATIIADIVTFPFIYCEIRWKLMVFEQCSLMLFKIKNVGSCECVYHTMMVKHYRDFAWIKVHMEIVIRNLELWSQTQMRFRHIALQLKKQAAGLCQLTSPTKES